MNPNPSLQEQAFHIARHLAESEEDVGTLFDEFGLEPFPNFIAPPLETDNGDILLQAACLFTNLANGSPQHQMSITSDRRTRASLRSCLVDASINMRRPFREVIPVLADLRKSEEFLWLMFRKTLKKLLEEDQRGGPADSLAPGGDPIGKFVQSLGGGEWINSGTFADGLRGAGISSERDLLVLSRNLENYTERIPFLREFATTNEFGWVIFQVGLECLSGQKASTSIAAQDYGTDMEGETYIKWFLDTIDPDKPLGHLAKDFVKAGVTNHILLLCVAEDIELAVDAMPFFRSLAAGDQLVWAMIFAGLSNLTKPA